MSMKRPSFHSQSYLRRELRSSWVRWGYGIATGGPRTTWMSATGSGEAPSLWPCSICGMPSVFIGLLLLNIASLENVDY